jgi:hypothetical protein
MTRQRFRALLNLVALVPRVGAINLFHMVDAIPLRARAGLTARESMALFGSAWRPWACPTNAPLPSAAASVARSHRNPLCNVRTRPADP